MLHSSWNGIVLQEIPDEISLAISISGCPLQCKGCHSTETWISSFGVELTTEMLDKHLNKYVSCVLFYGGEWNLPELTKLILYIKSKGIKTALYTGREMCYFSNSFLELLDYIKTGPYIKSLGGLDSKKSNQKLYKKNGGKFIQIK